MNQYRPGGFNMMPLVVKNLLIINGLLFLASFAMEAMRIDLVEVLGVYNFKSVLFKPFQLLTHMFMHGSFGHIFFNMFALWMFGSALENAWGPKRFLIFYMITGLGAAALHLGIGFYEAAMIESKLTTLGLSSREFYKLATANYPEINNILAEIELQFPTSGKLMVSYWQSLHNPTVGASGAVYGILLGFGMMFPNSLLYLYFLFPVKAKYVVIGCILLELYLGFANNPGDNIAHFAHLGGMVFGYIMIKAWSKSRTNFY